MTELQSKILNSINRFLVKNDLIIKYIPEGKVFQLYTIDKHHYPLVVWNNFSDIFYNNKFDETIFDLDDVIDYDEHSELNALKGVSSLEELAIKLALLGY